MQERLFSFLIRLQTASKMKLIFEQTPEHIKDLQKKVFLGGRGKIYLIIVITLVLLNAFNFIPSDVESNYENADTEISLALVLSWVLPAVIIVLVWYFIIKRAFGKNTIKKNSPSSIGPRELDITEENIHYKTNEFTGTFNWSGLTDFKETKLCYFLHIGKVQAIIVPKSAFESKEQEGEFAALVNKKLKM